MASYRYRILKEFNLMTVKEYLEYYHLGKDKIKKIHNNDIYINDKYMDINSRLFTDDILTISDNECLNITPFKKKLDIIYEDDYILIINKPVGVIIHSDNNQNTTNTLSNYVASYYKAKKLDIPVWYLHRLDKDTSGLIVFCKDILSMSYLSTELEEHKINRYYRAIVEGKIEKDEIIDYNIGRDRHINGKYVVSKTGKEAITYIKVVKNYSKYTYIELKLETGRTHQIRVHLSSIFHPLLGDELYGGNKKMIDRCALHSYHINFIHPITKEIIDVYSNIPNDMKCILEKR